MPMSPCSTAARSPPTRSLICDSRCGARRASRFGATLEIDGSALKARPWFAAIPNVAGPKVASSERRAGVEYVAAVVRAAATLDSSDAGRSAPTVYIETYGCQMNVSDSELMLGKLASAGYQPVDVPDGADVILVNTCAIRDHAEQRVIGRLGELKRHMKPDSVMGVTGCMAQRLGPVAREGEARLARHRARRISRAAAARGRCAARREGDRHERSISRSTTRISRRAASTG